MKQILFMLLVFALVCSQAAAASLGELTGAFGPYIGKDFEIVSPETGKHYIVKAVRLEAYHGKDFALIFEVQ